MTTTHREMRTSHPPGTGVPRPPWTQWLLGVVTFGIHAAFQHFRVNRELREFGIEVDPTKALLAFFPGGLVVVPYLITHYRTGERIAVAQETVGLTPTAQPELSALASIFALLHIPYQQTELNRVWAADTGSGAP
ncbi:MAG: DUF4234 domain-containing protein [Actinomycetia bacterium]|nr:DUF4234 domain-containing protein [Actinomycetes bacterium]MCP4958005.1 DUF4234 domain-containing protein [Actinomycetes bacterium]